MAGIRTNLGTPRGSYDELIQSDENEVVIASARGGTYGMLTSDATSKISSNYLASRVRYEFWDHSSTQVIPTASYAPLRIDGQRPDTAVAAGLTTWNTSSYKFQPEALGCVYTIRFTGIVLNPAKNGRIHLDIALSGATPPFYVANYNHQKHGYEYIVDQRDDHLNLAAVYTLFTDAQLLASGAQIFAWTDVNAGITLMSASLFIKEG